MRQKTGIKQKRQVGTVEYIQVKVLKFVTQDDEKKSYFFMGKQINYENTSWDRTFIQKGFIIRLRDTVSCKVITCASNDNRLYYEVIDIYGIDSNN